LRRGHRTDPDSDNVHARAVQLREVMKNLLGVFEAKHIEKEGLNKGRDKGAEEIQEREMNER